MLEKRRIEAEINIWNWPHSCQIKIAIRILYWICTATKFTHTLKVVKKHIYLAFLVFRELYSVRNRSIPRLPKMQFLTSWHGFNRLSLTDTDAKNNFLQSFGRPWKKIWTKFVRNCRALYLNSNNYFWTRPGHHLKYLNLKYIPTHLSVWFDHLQQLWFSGYLKMFKKKFSL